jgi:Coenzyme PQQ synthesis protein D (PqqD)
MYSPAADLIATDLEQERALLDPNDDDVLAPNASVRRIWFALPARTPDELANVLTSNVDVARGQALKDMHSLIAVLQGPGLVWYEDDVS